ncbi:MAG: succinate dehydrogenase, hydrophobic membrane anchor protein [Thermodesulfobacteriota bacterium]|nr:succinate dehydrogenase, hydrophobic membrane anchor protein [Thermodesulfobacteriota bacterium]
MSLNLISGRTGAFDWLFQRVSGVVLAVAFAVHFIVLHFLGDGTFTYQSVVNRLANPAWKVFDLCFLFFALYHAVTGIRLIIDDYIHNVGRRTFLTVFLWVLAICLFFTGAVIIFSLKAVG